MPSFIHVPRLALSLPYKLLLSFLLIVQPLVAVPATAASQPFLRVDQQQTGGSLQKSTDTSAEAQSVTSPGGHEHTQLHHPHLHIHPGTCTPGLSSHALAAAIALTTTVCGTGSDQGTTDDVNEGDTAVAAQHESVVIVQPPSLTAGATLPGTSTRSGMRLGVHASGQPIDAQAEPGKTTPQHDPRAGASSSHSEVEALHGLGGLDSGKVAAVAAQEGPSVASDSASLLPLVRGSGPPPVESIALSEGSLPASAGALDVLPLRPRHPPRVEVVPLGPTLANQRSTLSGDFFVGLASKPWVPIISGILALLLAGWIVVLLKE